ncbi:MAG TPA: hypothetical protein VGJ73_23880 [Verrucomicrobiae bacterium]|jgi:hypothetical protein
MNREIKSLFGSFFIEIFIYGALVVGYYFLVLHLMGNWLNQVYRDDRKTYAALSLSLIVVQGLFLEKVTRVLLRAFGIRKEPK